MAMINRICGLIGFGKGVASNFIHVGLSCITVVILILALPSLAQSDCRGMVLHAHRGAPTAPENSYSSVRQALEGDWDGAEIDIQQIRDDTWVLHHDPVLGRTTNLLGKLPRDLDSNTWRSINLKDRAGRPTFEPAPTLSELLRTIPKENNKTLNIEIKQLFQGCVAAQSAVNVLQADRPSGQWFLTAIDRRQLNCIRKLDPNVYLGQIILSPRELSRNAVAVNRLVNRWPIQLLDRSWLARLRQEVGRPVGVHIEAGTLSDYPSLLFDARDLSIPIFSYHLGPDIEHANLLRAYAARSGLHPSGAIIDGQATVFCKLLLGQS